MDQPGPPSKLSGVVPAAVSERRPLGEVRPSVETDRDVRAGVVVGHILVQREPVDRHRCLPTAGGKPVRPFDIRRVQLLECRLDPVPHQGDRIGERTTMSPRRPFEETLPETVRPDAAGRQQRDECPAGLYRVGLGSGEVDRRVARAGPRRVGGDDDVVERAGAVNHDEPGLRDGRVPYGTVTWMGPSS